MQCCEFRFSGQATDSGVSDFKGLLNSINQEMHLIKENKLAFMFLLSIWLRKLTHIGRHGSALAKRCERRWFLPIWAGFFQEQN